MITLLLIILVHVQTVSIPTQTMWAVCILEGVEGGILYKKGRWDSGRYNAESK